MNSIRRRANAYLSDKLIIRKWKLAHSVRLNILKAQMLSLLLFSIIYICVCIMYRLLNGFQFPVSIMDHGHWEYTYSDLLWPNFSILTFNPIIRFISIIFHWIKSQNWFYFSISLFPHFMFEIVTIFVLWA